jgi:hypothetical protein
MKYLSKGKDGNFAARRRERGAKMASYIYEECGDKYIKKYLIDAGNLTSVHVLGVSYFFEDGNFRGRIQTSALNTADVKRILNLNTKKERLTDFALSTKYGVKLNLTSIDPNGFNDVSSGEYDETHISFEVKSCSAELSYKRFDLEHGENGTTFIDKLTGWSWCTISLHEYKMKNNRTHYNFWVVEVRHP